MTQTDRNRTPGSSWGQRDSGTDDAPDRGGFGRMMEALRLVQERAAGVVIPEQVAFEVARALESLAATLEPFTVPEDSQIAGHLPGLPGRGQTLAPALHVDEEDDEHISARFTLGRFHHGSNGAAHGGVVPLVFDEALGKLSNSGRSRARTAYLHVNFRQITPIGVELRLEAKVALEEGRKRFLVGTIHHGDQLTADAEGLFVALRPGQP